MKYVKLFETFKVDERAPDYDEANFNLDKIFGDDQESIETFQEIEDRNDVDDMIDYINNWGDEEEMGRYGITTSAHIKKFAKSILESVNEGLPSKERIIPHKISPLPAVAIPEFPVVLKNISLFGVTIDVCAPFRITVS